MFLAVELWKESGLSQKEYAQQEGISLHTFKYWVKKYNADHKPKPNKNTYLKKEE